MSRVYVLARRGDREDVRMIALTAPEEAPASEYVDGYWIVRTKITTTVDALHRRYKFEVREEFDEDDPPRRAKMPWELLPAPPMYCLVPSDDARSPGAVPSWVLPTAGEAGYEPDHDHTNGPSPFDDYRRWLNRRSDPEPVNSITAIDALDLVRRPFRVGGEAAHVARQRASTEALDDVTIVLVCHGWGLPEQAAAERALDVVAALGPAARLSVVQNREGAPDGPAALAWGASKAGPRLRFQVVGNHGFGAACNVGARVAKTRFLLFTQPDAWFGADAVRLAVALSLTLAAEPSGGGRPAVVGPSGGDVPSWSPVFTEEGRNVERFGDPVPVEWVGGYWLLVERAAWRSVGGMWDRSFLYCEEPDVCLRLAAEGCRSFVWGDLPVNHQRGGTIKRRMLPSQVGTIHDDARREFSRRWGGRMDLGQPKR